MNDVHIILLLYKYFDSHIQFLNNSLHKQLYSQYDYLLSTIPFFPFWRKKQKPNYKHTKKKYYFTNLQNSYFKDIKNLKLNGATILDLSKKQKPETLIVVVKKINDGQLQIYLFMYDICPTHKQKKKNMKRKFSNS